MTKEQLGSLILDSERQLYSTAKTILFSDYDCADAIQETIVKAFSNVGTLKNDISSALAILSCPNLKVRKILIISQAIHCEFRCCICYT